MQKGCLGLKVRADFKILIACAEFGAGGVGEVENAGEKNRPSSKKWKLHKTSNIFKLALKVKALKHVKTC